MDDPETNVARRAQSQYFAHLNISAKKLLIFLLSGTLFDKFRFLRHILLKLKNQVKKPSKKTKFILAKYQGY